MLSFFIIITFNDDIIIIVVYTGSRCDSYQRGCGKPANEVLSGFPTIRLGAGSAKGGRDSLPYDDDEEDEEEEQDGYDDDDDDDGDGEGDDDCDDGDKVNGFRATWPLHA